MYVCRMSYGQIQMVVFSTCPFYVVLQLKCQPTSDRNLLIIQYTRFKLNSNIDMFFCFSNLPRWKYFTLGHRQNSVKLQKIKFFTLMLSVLIYLLNVHPSSTELYTYLDPLLIYWYIFTFHFQWLYLLLNAFIKLRSLKIYYYSCDYLIYLTKHPLLYKYEAQFVKYHA